MRLKDNWYRDVWMFVLSVLMIVFILVGQSQNESRINDIAGSRAYAVLYSCRQQNDRHDDTIRQLDKLVSKISDPKRRKEAEQGRVGTILLINALAPKMNCQSRVKKLTDSPPRPRGG